MAAAYASIMSSWLQPHLADDVKKLVGVVWFSRTSSGWGDLWIIMELHRWVFLLLCLRGGCGLLDPFRNFRSATNNARPTKGGPAVAARRRHGLKLKTKGISRILLYF
jgi:hypothetical protein